MEGSGGFLHHPTHIPNHTRWLLCAWLLHGLRFAQATDNMILRVPAQMPPEGWFLVPVLNSCSSAVKCQFLALPCMKPRSPFQRGENEFYKSDVPQIKLSGPSGDSSLLNQLPRSLFLLVDFSFPTWSPHGEAQCDFWNYLACNAGETNNLPCVICSRALPCNLLGFCMG